MLIQQAPQLETEHLILKQYTLEDFPALKECWATPEMVKINGGEKPTAETVWARLLRDIGHWQMLGYGYWAVFEKSTNRYAGSFGFMNAHREITPALEYPEAGWTLMPEVRGKGYAVEALGAILQWADETFSSPVCCIIDEENKRSNYLAERFGFQFQDNVNYRGKQIRLLVRQKTLPQPPSEQAYFP
jgi:RimJ/RimL family protein N-acetyltransferase